MFFSGLQTLLVLGKSFVLNILLLKEVYHILRYITFRKILNLIVLRLSFILSRMIKRPVIWGRPMALSIEPTTSCNLRCPECPSGLRSFTRPTGMLSIEGFRTMIGKVEKDLIYLNMYFQGEPFLNPDFFDMVQYARGKKIYTATSTNGHFLDDDNARNTVLSGLDKIIISIDGVDQETYAQYRVGGNLRKVIEGTSRLIRWKKKLGRENPQIIFQFIIFRFNEHQIYELRSLGRKTGVDEVKFKTAQVYDVQSAAYRIPENEAYSRYVKGMNGRYTLVNDMNNHCWRMWSSSVITWDGHLVPCCFDKDASYRMGNILTDPLVSIWTGVTYQAFRAKVINSRNSIDICSNCTEGTKVWA